MWTRSRLRVWCGRATAIVSLKKREQFCRYLRAAGCAGAGSFGAEFGPGKNTAQKTNLKWQKTALIDVPHPPQTVNELQPAETHSTKSTNMELLQVPSHHLLHCVVGWGLEMHRDRAFQSPSSSCSSSSDVIVYIFHISTATQFLKYYFLNNLPFTAN